MSGKRLSRRQFLTASLGAAGTAVLAACGPRTVEVEKVVEVPVAETVEVEVETIREVEKLVEVETVVEREVVRIAGEPFWSPPDLSGRELLIWGLNYQPHIDTYHRLGEVFAGYTGCTFKVEPLEWPIEDNIVTGMAAGLVPDVCCIMGQRIGPLVNQRAIVELSPVYEAVGCDVDTWFGPVALQAYQYGGQTWGVPTEGSTVSGIVNGPLNLIEEYGLEELWPPLNGEVGFRGFGELWALAEALQEEDGDGNVTRWGLSTEGWYGPQLLGVMRSFGQDWWDPEARTFALDSDAALEAMHLINYEPIHVLGIETHLGEACTRSQIAGQVAVACGNVTQPGTVLTEAEGMRVDNAVYPSAIPGRDALFVGEGGWGFIVPSQAQNQDIGIEFAKFLSTYEGQKEYARIYGGLVSACIPVNDDEELFPAGTLLGDAMRRGGVAQARTVYFGEGFGPTGEMTGIINAASEKVRIGEALPVEVMPEIQAELEEMLARFDAEQAAAKPVNWDRVVAEGKASKEASDAEFNR